MCRRCLVEVRPDKGQVCREAGADLLNYAGCAGCGHRDMPRATETRRMEDDDPEEGYEETIEFRHTCPRCEHFICLHHYSFAVATHESQAAEGETYQTQEFLMDCFLCGKGADSVLVDPQGRRPDNYRELLGLPEEKQSKDAEDNKPDQQEEEISKPKVIERISINRPPGLAKAAVKKQPRSSAGEDNDEDWE